ncbi:unnamed protein product [Acanthoscelides obtectus]|uniref:Uncharacterized protein n=1 Tax=Acanthoscelides obtectus TaxID=200917 RepID=A0A9P0MEJ3_ACAOB|nr:unnamed protein product [Acanthoscelides obtectus]CAK1622383.1 hypothetical protein AOBTE_LOCUS1457 [Acanthoscelides obtectus]
MENFTRNLCCKIVDLDISYLYIHAPKCDPKASCKLKKCRKFSSKTTPAPIAAPDAARRSALERRSPRHRAAVGRLLRSPLHRTRHCRDTHRTEQFKTCGFTWKFVGFFVLSGLIEVFIKCWKRRILL